MKIALIAPLAESVPPRFHGATERVVSYLTEELVRLGHDATRFENDAPARENAHAFDVLHFHCDAAPAHFPLFRAVAHKTVTTLHGRLDQPGMAELLEEFAEMPLVSVSNAQRAAAPRAHWAATVYHGLPTEVCPLNPVAPRGAARYLACLGHASAENGLERAIETARRAGVRLRIASVDESSKPAFLGNATALLFPVDWPEPFGLALIEAMSCGTPVIAWRNGSVPEVVEDGVTGFVVRTVDEAVRAAADVLRLDRTRVRERFDQRFSVERMVRDYLSVYRLLGRQRARCPVPA